MKSWFKAAYALCRQWDVHMLLLFLLLSGLYFPWFSLAIWAWQHLTRNDTIRLSTNCMRNVNSFRSHSFSLGWKRDHRTELDQMFLLSAWKTYFFFLTLLILYIIAAFVATIKIPCRPIKCMTPAHSAPHSPMFSHGRFLNVLFNAFFHRLLWMRALGWARTRNRAIADELQLFSLCSHSSPSITHAHRRMKLWWDFLLYLKENLYVRGKLYEYPMHGINVHK